MTRPAPAARIGLAELFESAPDVELTGLAYDSRAVQPGALFFCVPGFEVDGHDFAAEAVRRGAAALVVERELSLGVPEVAVDSVRAAMAPVAARFYRDPSAELKVVGITGTNGKTTTAHMLRCILEAAGEQCGLIGTVRTVIAGTERKGVRTTPEAPDVQRDLRAMVDGGDRACAMEVSSVGLALGRADAIHFALAVLTNLTADHLDFHGDLDAYVAAKRRLFAIVDPGRAVLNIDDEHGRALAAQLPGASTYAIESEADVRAVDVVLAADGASFRAVSDRSTAEIRSRMPGAFNVSNALAAIAAARLLGAGDEAIAAGIERAQPPPGRLQPIDEGQPFKVVIDYAHTPDAVARALDVLRAATPGRLVCVFGATGARFAPTRREMGAIAGRLSDRVVVSSDNPHLQDPAALEEIASGAGRDAEAIGDRATAIAHAIESAAPGDTVAVLGGELPLEDVELARAALRALAGAE